MKEKIPDLIVAHEKKEKERLRRTRRKKNTNNYIHRRDKYSFIYFLFLHNKNKPVEITTNNFDVLKGEISDINKYPSNNKLKGVILTNVVKKGSDKCTFKKAYISLANIRSCVPVRSHGNTKVAGREKTISSVIINGYKNLMVNEIYEKFKRIGG
ncbi:conserved Plasmodium protein, unknown function [Plasmodium knowlesi strain H]|uniref:Uncharacterized protein n=3 Tax=Plasmodium knowlesi TaxID=5850 RepID=A0A5K1U2S0_PLAKH|nr:conserved Plasmodium protein, unknown function [Plasmodium knowlesi strain H]OTN65178.1 Uncharacterized protein PKNOH_S120152700 [Plasmodium knowlesi]CAA9988384.1 conserved Plasmodium protein, unknown function [Plasmodium knowlesi strain H]SBO19987.1 conserved Plasmodium protein, unknown function [Plasmodium knowlesi strain H]SBO20352.1 conserved Plasmodium protein, unknown function [Plasmodium knowlesi strain H]VVS77858.1 conserved Plasmodium protein, unknown function [Plasmodium knowlesi |eukprot:XP_002259365.1 hypothetical protein, conserved in Plasmodium species [Plasmodium knowlesi strain H]